jgi:hypothetical protein
MVDPLSDAYSPAAAAEPEVKHRAADFPRPDLTQPGQFRAAVRHVSNVHAAGTPEEHEHGRIWYPKVHDATAKGARQLGISHMHAAGLVAALSPNMDFDRNNIGAFHEIAHMGSQQWDAITHSATATKNGPYHQRTQAAHDALRGTSLSVASDGALLKAHRILQGEHPDDVMPRRTNPKTNAFAHAIHDPEGSPHVTIDGRAHDIANNEMWPWTYTGRGISSAGLKSGKPTRYEAFEDTYRTAAKAADVHPNVMQARTWVTGKRIEKQAPSKSGAPRKVGVRRVRQPYV